VYLSAASLTGVLTLKTLLDEERLRYRPGFHNLALLELFGLLDIRLGSLAGGRGWRPEEMRMTDWGKALLGSYMDFLRQPPDEEDESMLDTASATKIVSAVPSRSFTLIRQVNSAMRWPTRKCGASWGSIERLGDADEAGRCPPRGHPTSELQMVSEYLAYRGDHRTNRFSYRLVEMPNGVLQRFVTAIWPIRGQNAFDGWIGSRSSRPDRNRSRS